ncbi:MAG: hypothetical protein ACTSYL_10925 [Candidatus Thorarchaeota archaeon]
MRFKSVVVTILLTSLILLGINTFQVSAHGDDGDNDEHEMPGMPGAPWFPWFPGWPGMMDMDDMPHYEMGEDTVWITSEVMTVMAMEEMPALHFWYSNDNNGSMVRFMAAYSMIAEFDDTNGDGAFQFNEALYYAPLGAYEWSIQTGSIIDDNGTTTEVWLKYTKGGIRTDAGEDHHMIYGTGIMPHMYLDGADVNRFENTTIQLWAHIYYDDYNGTIEDSNGVQATYAVAGNAELKVDIEIGNFPFSSNTSMAAIQTMLNENMAPGAMMMGEDLGHMFETRERDGGVMGNSRMNWTTDTGNESRFMGMPDTDMQQIDFMDSTTGVTQGFYRWVDKAVISWPGGVSEVVNVSASYVPTGMGVSLFFAYPNFDNGTLLHDPSVGLVEDAAPVNQSWVVPTVITAGVSIIGIIALIVVIRRRR